MPRSAELEKKRETAFATLEAAANEAGVTVSAYLRQMNKTGARDDESYDGPQRPALEVDGETVGPSSGVVGAGSRGR